MSKDRKDQTIAPILLNVPTTTVSASSNMQQLQLDQIVSPLITTTATKQPSFFDDRDHLFTAIAPTSDVNYMASTALKNRVTETPFCAPIIRFTRSSDPPPVMSSTLRPPVTTSEIKMIGNRSQPATSHSTITTGHIVGHEFDPVVLPCE